MIAKVSGYTMTCQTRIDTGPDLTRKVVTVVELKIVLGRSGFLKKTSRFGADLSCCYILSKEQGM